MERDITKKMLNAIHEGIEKNKHYTVQPIEDEEYIPKETFLSEAKKLMNEAVKKKINLTEEAAEYSDDNFEIKKDTPQFGDVYTSQVEQLKKTVEEDMEIKLVYYPEAKDLILNGKISSLNVAFQFRYKDPSGMGIYLWAKECQLSEDNTRKLGKIRDAFLNWKTNLIQNGDLLEKLHKASTKK